MNRLASALIAASIGLGLAGLWSERPWKDSEGTLTADPASCDFGSLAVKQRGIVNVRFRNDSGSPIRLLGAAGYCARKGCLSARGLPIQVAAGESVSVPVEVLPYLNGPFAQELRFYSDGPGRETLDLMIRGTVLADKSPSPAKPGASSGS